MLKNYSPTQQIGIKAEKVACKFLKKQGLSLITRNFITPLGEIDLIMQDSESIVFIEVRSRQPGLVTAMETVNLPKQQKIIRSANIYLQKNPTFKSCRFDVVSVTALSTEMEIHWIKDAFQVE